MAQETPGLRIVQRVYASGRSTVERAVRIADGASVIVKQPADNVVAAERVRRVLREYDALRAVQGPGVVEVLALVCDGGHAALILEDLGPVLARRIADHRMRPAEVLDVGIAIARSLARLHGLGFVHRDVNPNNVIYDESTHTAKLIDLDLAMRIGAQPADSALEGTLHYLAPEQTGRLNRPIDARSDLYSLGVTLYELFTRQHPFDGQDALSLVHAHVAQEPRRIDAINVMVASVLGDIVAKLMAKAPELRYQTATGLLADLERCRREITADGDIAAFPVGAHDALPPFEVADRLYGRAAEMRVLCDAFDRVAAGASETVLLAGPSGTGKSALVNEIGRALTCGHGHFASGKFEQLNRDAPYSAIVGALDELLAQVLIEAGATERWHDKLVAAAGDGAALVCAMLPALARIICAPPPMALDPEAARRQLAEAMARLIRVLAGPADPLVLFLDDMQWADAASLQLLTELASSEGSEGLLVIQAYRDNEIDEAHPFAAALRSYDRQGGALSRISLAPLTQDETTELVADALRQSPDAVAAAGAVIWRKTSGNPFYVRRFLHALRDDGWVAFDAATSAFVIDAVALDRAALAENVADLLTRQVGELPDATREVLVAAAALGTQFDAVVLARVVGAADGELAGRLAPAVAAGMLSVQQAILDDDTVGGARYRFAHDRIQQAVYEAATPALRQQLHLAIGRHRLAAADEQTRHSRLFDIVHHLSRGLALMTDESEQAQFVALASEAAQRARRSGAFDVAATLLRAVCDIRGWDSHHAVAFTAHLSLADMLSLSGKHDAAVALIVAAVPHAVELELALLAALEAKICTRAGRLTEALVHARQAAALHGVELPVDPPTIVAHLQSELGVIMTAIAAKPIETWIDLPPMTDIDKLDTLELLVDCVPAAYQTEPVLGALLCAKIATLSLTYGNAAASARGYVSLCIPLWQIGRMDEAFRVARLGVELSRRIGDNPHSAAVDFVFSGFAAPWRLPLAEAAAGLRATVNRAIEAGDIAHAISSASFACMFGGMGNALLEERLDLVRQYRKLCQRFGLRHMESWMAWSAGHIRRFLGTAPEADEPDLERSSPLETFGSFSLELQYLAMELEWRYWSGDNCGAAELARAVRARLDAAPALAGSAEYRLYICLSSLACDGANADIAGPRADLARYAEICPSNFLHLSALVEAEHARVTGDVARAIEMYDTAIEAASTQGFVKAEALIHEHAAQFWAGRGKPAFAAVHIAQARDLCEHWGARPRARELELARRRLGATEARSAYAGLRTSSASASTLDFATVVKASHAIASDMVLDSLLGKMMEIIIENAGAQSGAIVLSTSGALAVHASKQSGAAVVVTGGTPLAGSRDVPDSIIKHVVRVAEYVVLGDATRHPLFRNDPYVRARRPRSVLCLPISHKDRTIGAVYLENNLVADAFTIERLDALGILVAQLAISIENAIMVSRLEELVARRTQALTEANHQLREQALVRERMESELRLAQKLQSVGQLAAGVAHEINTPMQFIGNNVAFLREALDDMFAIIAAYRAAVDPETGRGDAAAMDRADRDHDLELLQATAPSACAQAVDGIARVSRIIVAMRAFSHPDPQTQTPVSLRTEIENTLVVAGNALRDVADVTTDLAELPEVMCHRGEIGQVFLNLLVNSAHAIEDVIRRNGGRGKISIRTWRDGGTAVVEIADTGGGIPDAIRDRVFDPFFTTKTVGRGTGQGLALARTAVVDRHGGTLEFVTRPGEGTTFYVRLPIHGRPAAEALHAFAAMQTPPRTVANLP